MRTLKHVRYLRSAALGVTIVAGLAATDSLSAAAQRRLTEQEFVDAMNKGLDAVRSKLERLPKNGIKFSGNLFFAHGAVIRNISTDTLIAYVDMLKDAGVQRVDINPGVFPFRRDDQGNIAKYDRVVQRIREHGLELAINPEPNRGEMKLSRVADWEEECVALYGDLARRYRPDIFVLIHEPTTMDARMGTKGTPEDWRRFVQRTAAVVKKESPKTRVAAGGLSKEMDYFRTFVQMNEVDVLTINVYDIGQLSRYNEMIEMARRAGKPTYIGETWRSPFVTGPTANLEELMTVSLGDEKFRALDIKWLEVIAMYASVMKLEAITPFWTTSLVAYMENSRGVLSSEYNTRVIQGLARRERTPTFNEFRELVKKYR
jgi:hypothetical protein